MKAYLLGFLISVLAFVITSSLLPGLNYHNSPEILIKTAAVFAVLNIFVRPIVRILLMPLNFLTMGFLGGVSGLIILWLLTIIPLGFSLSDSFFPGYLIWQVQIPSYHLNALITVILGASLLSLLSSSLYWLTR